MTEMTGGFALGDEVEFRDDRDAWLAPAGLGLGPYTVSGSGRLAAGQPYVQLASAPAFAYFAVDLFALAKRKDMRP